MVNYKRKIREETYMEPRMISYEEAKRLLEKNYTIEEEKEESAVISTRDNVNQEDLNTLQKMYRAEGYEISGTRKNQKIEIELHGEELRESQEEGEVQSEDVKVMTPNGNSKEYDTVEEAVQDDNPDIGNTQSSKHKAICKECGEEFYSDDRETVDKELKRHWEEEHDEDDSEETDDEQKQEESETDNTETEKEEKSSDEDTDKDENNDSILEELGEGLTVTEVRNWEKEKVREAVYKLMDEEGMEQTGNVIQRFWGEDNIETNSPRYNIVYGAISKLSEEDKIRREGRGEYKVVQDDRPEYLPNKAPRLELTGHTTEDIDDMSDCHLSEILLQILAEKEPEKIPVQELANQVLKDGEDIVDVKFRLVRVLDQYLNGVIVTTEEDGETCYGVSKLFKSKLLSDKPCLYQVLNSEASFYKCQECDSGFEDKVEARKHRKEKNHFNWELMSTTEKKMVNRTATDSGLEWGS